MPFTSPISPAPTSLLVDEIYTFKMTTLDSLDSICTEFNVLLDFLLSPVLLTALSKYSDKLPSTDSFAFSFESTFIKFIEPCLELLLLIEFELWSTS